MTGKVSGFRSLLGYRISVWREGHAEIELVLDARHMNSLGIVHGGLYATLLDAACGHAVAWCPVADNIRVCVTLSLTTNFLRPITAGRIVTRGVLETSHDRIAVARAEVIDEAGLILAIGQGSFRYGPGSEHLAGVPRTGAPLRP